MSVKPGYRTSEFWATAGVYVGGLLNLTGAWDYMSNWHSGLLITVASAAYAFSRGVAKHGQSA